MLTLNLSMDGKVHIQHLPSNAFKVVSEVVIPSADIVDYHDHEWIIYLCIIKFTNVIKDTNYDIRNLNNVSIYKFYRIDFYAFYCFLCIASHTVFHVCAFQKRVK